MKMNIPYNKSNKVIFPEPETPTQIKYTFPVTVSGPADPRTPNRINFPNIAKASRINNPDPETKC